ncbi:hypothetical protein D9611_010437 [Ephemerocybe angulata]|uniref:Required for respiratory growth protein 9, mitochondrial n=1 Tax=Ephemerocybe angulata TaxID=980116 RepID=A0A8H5FB12_9AGAR|nr:hypothetical protein D9611_010437 [Tulosesus angulatus]
MASSLRTFLNLQRSCTRHQISRLYTPHPSLPAPAPRSPLQSRSVATTSGKPAPAKAPLSILEDDDAEIDLSEDDDLVNGLRPGTAPLHLRKPTPTSTPDEWRAHRAAIKARFPDGWAPPRKISREAMAGLRQLHALNPATFTTEILADKFRISPEAVRRILKSRWEPSSERKAKLVEREKAGKSKRRDAMDRRERDQAMPFMKEKLAQEERGEDQRRAGRNGGTGLL